MKKRIIKLLTTLVGITALTACGKEPNFDSITTTNKLAGISYQDNDYFSVESNSLIIEEGATKQIKVITLPEQYALEQIVYESLDESVATVSETGLITAVSKGVTCISVHNKDNSISTLVNVGVYRKATADEKTSVLEKMKEEQGSKRKYFTAIESSFDYYYREGVMQYGSESMEKIVYDASEGYLLLDSVAKYYNVEGGAPEIYRVKYIFYTINFGSFTRFIGMRPGSKNYIDVNTSDYNTDEEIMYDVCNTFFSMGAKIITNTLDDINGLTDFASIVKNAKTVGYIGEDALCASYTETGKDTTTPEDEIEYMDIPAYTEYDYTFQEDEIFVGPYCQSYAITMVENYHDFRDDKDWSRKFIRNKLFSDEVELEKYDNPSEKGFTLVDSVYDI